MAQPVSNYPLRLVGNPAENNKENAMNYIEQLEASHNELLRTCEELTAWLYAIRKADEIVVIDSAPDGVSLCAAQGVIERAKTLTVTRTLC